MNIILSLYNDALFVLRFVFITLCVIYSYKFLSKLLSFIKKEIDRNAEINRLKNGIINLSDINKLTPREFEHWCGEFLSKEGYTNIVISPKGSNGGKDIVCSRGIITYFAECEGFSHNKNTAFKVTPDICKKLIGAMEPYNITHGLILTTGTFTKDALMYIHTLPSPYNIELYDGKDLIKEYKLKRGLTLSTN